MSRTLRVGDPGSRGLCGGFRGSSGSWGSLKRSLKGVLGVPEGVHKCPAADHRHFSPHVHQPLSKPPNESRRKKSNQGRKEGRRGSAPNAAATIEEDHEEEEDEEESSCQSGEEGGRTTTPTR